MGTRQSTTSTAREALLGRTLVDLADTLVEDFKVLDYLYMLCDRCLEALDIDEVGVMLANPDGVLELTAASNEQTATLELLEMQKEEGPCHDAFRTGGPIAHADLATADAEQRWPRFAPRAVETGSHSVYALPLRLRDEVIGALNMFRHEAGAFGGVDVLSGRAMADMATIGIMQERAVRSAEHRAEQLQRALDGRVIVEQAKGALSERLGVAPDEAFTLLRDHAQSSRRRLTDICRAVIAGDLALG